MLFLEKLTPERQVWLREILQTQCSDIYCDELLEHFAEKVHYIETDDFSQKILANNGRIIIEVPFRGLFARLVIAPFFLEEESHALH